MKHEDEFIQLAEGLHKVPPSKFKQDWWGGGKLDVESEGFECNYSGCAMGWMPKLVPQNTLVSPYGGFPCIFSEDGRFLKGFNAIAEYFGISVTDARHLFGVEYDDWPVKPITVAARMMDFLEMMRGNRETHA